MPKFKIVGTKEVDGKKPGEIITLNDLQQIFTLTKGGHIAAIKKNSDQKKINKTIKDIEKENK